MGNVGLGVGYVTRIWRVEWAQEELEAADAADDADGAALRLRRQRDWCSKLAACDAQGTLYHWVMMRHYENGKVSVYVDGAFEASGTASFNNADLKYRVGQRVGHTRVGFNEGSKFDYTFATCLVLPNGSELRLKELNETLMDNHDPNVIMAEVSATEVEQQHRPGQAAAAPKAVAMYTVKVQARDSEPLAIKKRFSEFVDLDRLVRSAFHGSHLLSSLPSLPPRQSKMLSNHLDPGFIERRRQALDAYLKKLVMLPRIPQNPDVLEFLGMLPPLAASNAPPVVVV